MAQKFFAQAVTHVEHDQRTLNLEMTLVDETGTSQVLSLSPSVVSELATILKGHLKSERQGDLTRMPQSYAVGHGRYEPVVLLRFEDDVAYGLTADMAIGLGEALVDEVYELREQRYPVRQ